MKKAISLCLAALLAVALCLSAFADKKTVLQVEEFDEGRHVPSGSSTTKDYTPINFKGNVYPLGPVHYMTKVKEDYNPYTQRSTETSVEEDIDPILSVMRFSDGYVFQESGSIPAMSHYGTKGKMTVNEGVTVTVDGVWEINHILDNYGTIVLRYNNSDELFMQDNFYALGLLLNNGTINNYGTIKIVGGRLDNYWSGVINNMGTIEITKVAPEQAGVRNLFSGLQLGSLYGTIRNNGDIVISCDASGAVRNISGALLQNNGTITAPSTNKKPVSGAVQGNVVTTK
ncbi:MAG: hypothetical protein ACK5LX_12870 [Oscillospiraceae bacterium]